MRPRLASGEANKCNYNANWPAITGEAILVATGVDLKTEVIGQREKKRGTPFAPTSCKNMQSERADNASSDNSRSSKLVSSDAASTGRPIGGIRPAESPTLHQEKARS